VDEKNCEIIVADTSSRSLLVFARDADGDAAPKRIIAGPKTVLLFIVGVAVDAVHDRMRGGTTGLFIFNRMDREMSRHAELLPDRAAELRARGNSPSTRRWATFLWPPSKRKSSTICTGNAQEGFAARYRPAFAVEYWRAGIRRNMEHQR
jgi:hypothetical protein